MKKTIYIVILILSCGLIRGQTVHNIIISNTDDQWLSSINDVEKLNAFSKEIARNIGYKLINYKCFGVRFTKRKVLATINDVNINEKDIVLIYVSSHGFSFSNQDDEFPWVVFTDRIFDQNKLDEYSIAFSEIIQFISNKKPRLILGIIDACNNYQKERKLPESIDQLRGPVKLPYIVESISIIEEKGPNKEVYNYLFENIRGKILACSSKYGNVSFSNPEGGVYTNSLISTFNAYVSNKKNISWYNILNDAAINTDTFLNRSKKQEPYFEIDIEKIKDNENSNLIRILISLAAIIPGFFFLKQILVKPGKKKISKEFNTGLLENYKNQLAEGETRKVIEYLLNEDIETAEKNDLTNISASFEQLERDIITHVLTKDDERIERNRINFVLISLIDKIERKSANKKS